jgi:hypothetical protein
MNEHIDGYIPEFLQDYSSMCSHLNSQVHKLRSSNKGVFFEKLASEIVAEYPETDLPIVKMNCEFTKGSWEDGVDITFKDDEESTYLYVQVKWSIDSVDDLDLILSKFHNYYQKNHRNEDEDSQRQLKILFPEEGSNFAGEKEGNKRIEFMIITLKKDCNRILGRYKEQNRPSLAFYDFLSENRAFHFINGDQVFNLLKTNLSRFCGILPDVKLRFESEPIKVDNVFIGVISAGTLANCYSEARESLFFENVRLFKGDDSGKKKAGKNREPVNTEILRTVVNEPSKMLARNNGITFRAQRVVPDNDDPSYLFLEKASIVNGCQTTYMVAKGVEQSPQSGVTARIFVKIVETDSSWDVAEAANFQNRINQLDLKLARYLRPQIAIRAGMQSGINIEYETESFIILDKLSSARTSYEDVKVLFLGLFSRSASNSISANYTDLRYGLLDQFLEQRNASNDSILNLVIEVESRSSTVSDRISEKLSEAFADLFKRFLQKGSYRAFLTITAACVLTGKNIYTDDVQLADLEAFLETVNGNEDEFLAAYRSAFMTLANRTVNIQRSKDENLKDIALRNYVRTYNWGRRTRDNSNACPL